MKITVIIPARYASTRFPGKPLALINGKAMLDHVYDLAVAATRSTKDVDIIVATDDDRIETHCNITDKRVLRTSENCKTGSDRVLEAAVKLDEQPDIVINLQGDVPLMPQKAISGIIRSFAANPEIEVATPVKQLSWSELDKLRLKKQKTPFSGTTVAMDKHQKALWFSKNILPAIRKEDTMRMSDEMSPVYQHLGLYGYRFDTLKRFVNLKEGVYEKLEGLEQLRFLENNIDIHCVPLPIDTIIHNGIDSPSDVETAEMVLRSMR